MDEEEEEESQAGMIKSKNIVFVLIKIESMRQCMNTVKHLHLATAKPVPKAMPKTINKTKNTKVYQQRADIQEVRPALPLPPERKDSDLVDFAL